MVRAPLRERLREGGVVEDGDERDTWRSAAIGPASNLVLTIGDRPTGSRGFQAVQEKAKS